jgi:hypothetical protein
MSTVPLPAGEVAVSPVAELTVNELAATPPNFTLVAPAKLVPVIVTDVPPAVGPDDGLTLVIAGAGLYVNSSDGVVDDDPPVGVVTVMSSVPGLAAGEVAVIWVAESTVNEVAPVAPNLTALAPVRLVPVIVTVVPPAAGPDDGLTFVTLGAGLYVNWSAAVLPEVPSVGVVTVMSTVPVPAGEVAVIWVALLTVKDAAAVPPKLTAVAPVKLVPVIFTDVPPAAGPEDGLTFVTVGAPL